MELYQEFLTNSHPSGSEFGITINEMKQKEFDWWDNSPHLVITWIWDIDLNATVNLDEDDKNMFIKCCAMLDISKDNKDSWED
mgnify:CR=1 FL=1|tara:strand:+ start:518 stop:766 length:249 start_codon:yes stop_codon:yes gene_type:complete